MRLIFGHATQLPIATHPFRFIVYIKNSENGWSNGEKTLDTAEQWIKFIHRKLLTLGITDSLYELDEPDTANNESCRFNFYFKTELQYLQFQAAAAHNTQRDFARDVTAKTARESLYQEQRISHFLRANEINHKINRKDAQTLTVTTSQREDDLILAMQILNKSFDSEQAPRRSTNIPMPFTYR